MYSALFKAMPSANQLPIPVEQSVAPVLSEQKSRRLSAVSFCLASRVRLRAPVPTWVNEDAEAGMLDEPVIGLVPLPFR
jgi:hypothetical protein